MNLNKLGTFFDPINLNDAIHIIGCGAIGSHIAEMLTRMGVQKLNIYDFDKVTPHNLTNQMFNEDSINLPKVNALEDLCEKINSDIEIVLFPQGYTVQPLAGYVFLCVDNIDLRREIATNNRYNPNIKAMFDFRMRLTDAQHYAADWKDPKSIDNFLASMQFTHEEAKVETPVSACGTSLNVIPTVRVITALGVGNWMNFIKDQPLKKLILIDAFSFIVDAF